MRDDGVVQIHMGETLNYNEYKPLKEIYKQYPPETNYILNFAKTNLVDSSGLGLLLAMKHYTKTKQKIAFVKCNSKIKQIFGIAQFQMLFDIQ